MLIGCQQLKLIQNDDDARSLPIYLLQGAIQGSIGPRLIGRRQLEACLLGGIQQRIQQ